MSSLVSIVIPVYNCESFVGEAVESALAQDYPAKEVIVVNDGSVDGSLAALRHFGAAIRLIDVPNGGPARARNIGLRAARGEYVAFLDADDIWLPGKLSAQVKHLEAHLEVGVCCTGWHVWAPAADGRFVHPVLHGDSLPSTRIDRARSGWIYNQLLFGCEVLTSTVMLRMSAARAVGEFAIGLPVGEDYDYWLRLSRHAKVTRLACVGALYRVLPTSASRAARAINFEHRVVRAAIDRFGPVGPDGAAVDAKALERHLERLVFQHGYLHLKSGDPSIALQSFTENLRARPWQPRLWVHSLNALFRIVARRSAAVHP